MGTLEKKIVGLNWIAEFVVQNPIWKKLQTVLL